MECDNVKELLPFLDDDSLRDGEAEDVRAHLEQCENCRREYENQIHTLQRFQAFFSGNESGCSREFLAGVRAKIRRKKEARVLYRMAFSAAAVVVLALGVTLYGFLQGASNQNIGDNFAFEDSAEDFENYVAARYLSMYELNSILDESDESDESYESEESALFQAYVSFNYVDITPEDIIDTLDDDDLELVLASY